MCNFFLKLRFFINRLLVIYLTECGFGFLATSPPLPGYGFWLQISGFGFGVLATSPPLPGLVLGFGEVQIDSFFTWLGFGF
ncbi:hypothetical protein L6452_21092 [Arctium lappa]|uniref:Uncharacterized protein n=1 Tax=Arctium lappa TaxID=4217 RepID=A0ACB9BCC0_ARCLA|nr:hypothetical protein L6452_21092 [Arctium lappa]